MRSIQAEQELSGEEIRTMTRRWGYTQDPAPIPPRQRKKIRRHVEMPESIKALLSVTFTLAGAATTSIAFAWLVGWI